MFDTVNTPTSMETEESFTDYTRDLDTAIAAAQRRLAFARKIQTVLFEGESVPEEDIIRSYFCNDTERETFVIHVRVNDYSDPFLTSLINDNIPNGVEVHACERNDVEDNRWLSRIKLVIKTTPDER